MLPPVASRLVLAAAVLALSAAAVSSAGGEASSAWCKGAQLAGAFRAVPGSAGAGNISYTLTLRNVSHTSCIVSGLPQGRLLGKTGKQLPTNVGAANPGALTAVLARLAPGASTHATARFTPDVPGPGEPVTGTRCEPVAYWFRVSAPGGGTARAKLAPPTPVCVHGRLLFSAYSG
jgi:Domain of unknown function (DUF4232)